MLNLMKPSVRWSFEPVIGVAGPSGSGRSTVTMAVLDVLTASVPGEARVAVIDTSTTGRSPYQSDATVFEVLEWRTNFNVERLAATVTEIVESGMYDAVVIDTLSPFWSGMGGAVEAAKARGRNSDDGWAKVGAAIADLFAAPRTAQVPVVCVFDCKTEWVMFPGEDGQVPLQIGLGVKWRDGIESDFDLFLRTTTDFCVDVVKSATATVPHDRHLPATPGTLVDAVRQFATWSRAGVRRSTRAQQSDIAAIFAGLPEDVRREAKRDFVNRHGLPEGLSYDEAAAVLAAASEPPRAVTTDALSRRVDGNDLEDEIEPEAQPMSDTQSAEVAASLKAHARKPKIRASKTVGLGEAKDMLAKAVLSAVVAEGARLGATPDDLARLGDLTQYPSPADAVAALQYLMETTDTDAAPEHWLTTIIREIAEEHGEDSPTLIADVERELMPRETELAAMNREAIRNVVHTAVADAIPF